MDNDPLFSLNLPSETPEPALVEQVPVIYPPKPEVENKKGNVWIRSAASLALYLLIGYFFFSANWVLLLILTGIVIFHEFGHFLAMKLYHYKELGIFFIPLLGAYASGTKREVSQKQSAVILLAGPLPGIILGIALFLLTRDQYRGLSLETYNLLRNTASLLIFLNVLNLLPVYPLDGGQILNRLFLDESKIVGKIFVVLSALAMAYFAITIEFYPLLVFPAMMLFRLRSDTKYDELTKKVEAAGINLEKSYEEISDEDYWKIRDILLSTDQAGLKNVNPAPPYEYSPSEDKVVAMIENILQRTVIQDVSWIAKGAVVLIWAASFATPFLLNMDIPLLHYHAR